jgi:hypothetical protein
MLKKLLILLLPLALAGCVTGQNSALPMAFGPSDTAQASCLRIGDAPTLDACDKSGSSLSQAK